MIFASHKQNVIFISCGLMWVQRLHPHSQKWPLPQALPLVVAS